MAKTQDLDGKTYAKGKALTVRALKDLGETAIVWASLVRYNRYTQKIEYTAEEPTNIERYPSGGWNMIDIRGDFYLEDGMADGSVCIDEFDGGTISLFRAIPKGDAVA